MDIESIRREVEKDMPEYEQWQVEAWMNLAYLDILSICGVDIGGAIADYLLNR